MTNDEYNARRNAILAEIEKYTTLLNDLSDCREAISEKDKVIKDDVETPVCKPYDLSENDTWRGKNYTAASEKVNDISTNVKTYRSDVLTMLGQIDTVLRDLQDHIESLYKDLAALG